MVHSLMLHGAMCIVYSSLSTFTAKGRLTNYIRGAQAVHSAQCAMMGAALPCTRARDGPARHVAGEGRAASAIGGEGERTLSERGR
jgi:hypothetical protein